MIVGAIGCAVLGGLIIDRGFAPMWFGIVLISVSLTIAAFAYGRRVARRKRRGAPR